MGLLGQVGVAVVVGEDGLAVLPEQDPMVPPELLEGLLDPLLVSDPIPQGRAVFDFCDQFFHKHPSVRSLCDRPADPLRTSGGRGAASFPESIIHRPAALVTAFHGKKEKYRKK